MSGICGISEIGRRFGDGVLTPMLEGLALPGESQCAVTAGMSVALGVARRWSFQQAAAIEGISVVIDADLVDRSALVQGAPLDNNRSIAEIIAQQYLKCGIDVLNVLHGGFSLALWDERNRRLVLAIDRLGVKSLYWRCERGRLMFASRAGALRAIQEECPRVNPTSLLQFLLFSVVPAPLSIDEGTRKLRPGTLLIFENGDISEKSYWDVTYPESKDRGERQWAYELREGLRAAVHRHLDDCEPAKTGCYLSGGTDSSSVVAFTSEIHHPAQSFSIAFEEAGFSEIEFARMAAARFRTRHYEKFLTPRDAETALERIIGFYDEPFANSSAIGSYYCALLAREQGVQTLLAGDGGDELFGGNERYAHDKRFALYHSLPTWLRRFVIAPAVRLLPENAGAWSLPRKYVRRAEISNPRRILSYGFFLTLPSQEIFEDGFLEQVGMNNWLAIPEEHFHRASAENELNRILYMDLKMTLADNDLRKVSGTAELAGVNVRYPLLDERLVELSGRMPARLKLKGLEKRYIFKQAMKDILPAKILYKKKHGFGVPLAQWLLRNPRMRALMLDVMHDRRTRQRGYFRPEFFDRLMTLHETQPNFYGEIVWYLLALELWHRFHFEKRPHTAHVA